MPPTPQLHHPLNWARLAIALILPLSPALAAEPKDTPPPRGTLLLTVEGKVDVALAGTVRWTQGYPNQPLATGDRLRTGFKSRATVQLSDLSILRVKELTTLQIQEPAPNSRSLLNINSGGGYFYNRQKPSELQFRTPQISGAVRGTEFIVEVTQAGETIVTLLDGEVLLQNDQGQLTLTSGEQGSTQQGAPPRKTAVINAINILQWALYYPAVIHLDDLQLSEPQQQNLAGAINAYRQGDLPGSLSLYPGNHQPASDPEKVFRAAQLLAAGAIDEIESLLGSLSTPSPASRALAELIATVKHQPLPQPHTPQTASEWIARSYSLQSTSDLPGALHAARTATRLAPAFGAAWIRVAELEFSFGRTPTARTALNQGLDLSPKNAHGLALMGFLLSARNNPEDARTWFDHAINADGALANGWLGRGLVRIRQGDTLQGRRDLQVAAALEPTRALLRSYVGKAFSHTGQLNLAGKEFRLATELDPNDPTPWLYSALLDQQRNEINRAIGSLEKSSDLNDNRSLFRSRLLLDQDQAVRSANLAAIYKDAGMTDVSFREASQAVNFDYANYSAHLFLANSYDALRDPKLINLRFESAWFSELLVAQLLAPVGATPLSQNISAQEYSRFFEGNRLGLFSSTGYLSNGDWIQSGSQYGVIDNSSYSVDAYYRTENGHRPNNDLEQLSLSLRFKQQLTPEDSVFLLASYFDMESGDLAQYHTQSSASTTQRVEEQQEPNVYFGYHHQWQPGIHTLLLGARLDDRFRLTGTAPIINLVRGPGGAILGGFTSTAPIELESDFDAYSIELQQIWQMDRLTLVAGGRYQTGESTSQSTISTAVPIVSPSFNTGLQRISAYAYNYWQALDQLQLMAGLTYDSLDYPENIDLVPISGNELNRDQISPKAGFHFSPFKDTTLRGLYTKSLGGLFYDTSLRLEPTQLAGFNQAFRSMIPESVAGLVPGSEFETFGLAIDQQFSTRTYLSLSGEILHSEADRTLGTLNLGIPSVPSSTRETLDFRERSLTLTLNQLIAQGWAIGASYRITDADLKESFAELPPTLTPPNTDTSATLHQINLHATFNMPCGFFAQAASVWSHQSNHGYTPGLSGDDFWQHNAFVGYRFLQRRAEARAGLLNITGQDYQLNPLTLYNELPRERTLVLSLKLFF